MYRIIRERNFKPLLKINLALDRGYARTFQSMNCKFLRPNIFSFPLNLICSAIQRTDAAKSVAKVLWRDEFSLNSEHSENRINFTMTFFCKHFFVFKNCSNLYFFRRFSKFHSYFVMIQNRKNRKFKMFTNHLKLLR